MVPGCRRPARQCEIDHRVPYSHGGATAADNLCCLCKHHHRQKDGGGFTLSIDPDGTTRWTTPLGRSRTRGPTQLHDLPDPHSPVVPIAGGPLRPDAVPVSSNAPPDDEPPF